MKKLLLFICIASMATSQAQVKKTTTTKKANTKMVFTPPKTVAPGLLKNAEDSFSYAIGLEGASYYKSQ